MNSIINTLEQFGFLNTLWLFFVVFVLHELEEWNISKFEHRNFIGLSSAATDRSVRMWIAAVSLIGLIWCAVATIPGNPVIAAWIFLPAIAIMMQNALQHIYWSFYFRQYAPGVITSALFLIPFGCYIAIRSMQHGYVPLWYMMVCAALIVIGAVQTIMAGNKMTPLIRAINNIGIALSEKIDNLWI